MKQRAFQLQECETFLVDVGGVLRVGGTAIEGAADFLSRVRRKRIDPFLFTNITSISTATLVSRLNADGFHVQENQCITANLSTIEYMKRQGIVSAYVVGTDDQRAEFEQHGIQVHATHPEAVVVSFSPQLNYEMLTVAADLLRQGAQFLVTNPDANHVVEKGVLPDAGATTSFLRTATGCTPEVVGKPSHHMVEFALSRIGIPPERIAIIGDQMDIDMKVAEEYGMVSVLVLSGQQRREDLASYAYQPDYVVDSVASLIPLFL